MAAPRRILSRRLSALDAFFLYIETPEAPLQIGGIDVFDGPLSRDRLVARLADRMDEIPRYRQRVVPAPFGLGHPFWEDAPGFDPGEHVSEITLDPPGDDAALQSCVARLFEQRLPRERPLWDLQVIHGVAGGRSALAVRIHHAMVDGVSGVELLDVLFDLTADGQVIRPPAPAVESGPSWPAGRLAEVLWDAGSELVRTGVRLARQAGRLVTSGREPVEWGIELAGTLGHAAAEPVVRLPFNRPLTGARRLAWTSCALAEVGAIREAAGGTLNDVVLAVVTDAIGRLLLEAGEPTRGRSLRLMVPVNVRRQDERGQLGNRVSMVPVEAPFEASAVERLRTVQAATTRIKRVQLAEVVEELVTLGGLLPAPMYAAALALSARPAVLKWSAPLRQVPPLTSNLVCTNVPGPKRPLYAQGRRVLAHYPVVPLAYEYGLGVAAFSYDGRLFFGLIADGGAIDDLSPVARHVDAAFDELRAAATGRAVAGRGAAPRA